MHLKYFRPFEWLILFMICANCIALAVYQPYPAQDSDTKNTILVSSSLPDYLIMITR
uniref:Neur_chan_memb domain-containing protein n=1 Tax=Ascaris lumbricoides TaxID=6252 RepID=A0A0M3HH40_ASCLU